MTAPAGDRNPDLTARARRQWTPDDWLGRARTARARELAGSPLNRLDLEALTRHPNPPMTQPRKAPP